MKKWRVVIRQPNEAARVIERKTKREATAEAALWGHSAEIVHPNDWYLFAGVLFGGS